MTEKFKLTKGEFSTLVEIQGIMDSMNEAINTYKPFMEDPTDLFGELEYSVTELTKKVDLLKRLNEGLKAQDLRG